MKYETLDRSNLKISKVGFGGWAAGGRQWGVVKDADSIKAICRARQLGVNFFDTADVYGLGHSERIIGKTIGNDPDCVVATKVGLRWNNKGKIHHDLSRAYVKQACEASLKRLKRDSIDLYQIHWPDPEAPLDDTIDAFESLVKEGKIRFAGACNLPLKSLKRLSERSWFTSYQGIFHLFDLEAEAEIIPLCRQEKIAFVAYEPLAKGLLTGKFTTVPSFGRGDHRKYDDRFTARFPEYAVKVGQLKRFAVKNGITTAQLALALLLRFGATTVIPGMKTAVQVVENVGAIEVDRRLLDKYDALIGDQRVS